MIEQIAILHNTKYEIKIPTKHKLFRGGHAILNFRLFNELRIGEK